MEFTYTNTFYVEEADIAYMVDCVISKDYSVEEAVDDWASGLDDADFYAVGYIEDDLIQVINDMANKIKNEKMLDK
jgi:hypothetical protein